MCTDAKCCCWCLIHIIKSSLNVQLWTSDGKGWGLAAASTLDYKTEGLRDTYVDALLQGRHQQLCDFDDHLNDIAK